MNTANESEKLPYKVKEPLWVKILVVALVGLQLLFSTRYIDSFNNSDLLGILFLIEILGITYVLVRLFFARTVLDEQIITNTNSFLIKKQFSYQDIKDIKMVGYGNLKLILNNGSRIKILCGTDNLNRVISIINSRTSKSLFY